MALETGVVLKTSRNRCVVLTPQGEFRSVPRVRDTVTVGQEIQYTWPPARTNWRLFLAAASLFVALVTGTLFTSIFPAAGYVSVDINPSIELGMNAWGRVVRAQALNGDGKDLLQAVSLYGRTLDQALDDIAQKAVAMHYLKPGNPDNLMVVTYTPGNLALPQPRREEAYEALATELKADGTPVRLLFADVTPAQRYQARQMGLSVGKYLVRERLMSRGVNIPAQQMARTSIAKVLLAEKLQLDAIMGPNTTYREVQPEGMTVSSPTESGVTVQPGVHGIPAVPSRQQGTSRQVSVKQTWWFSNWMQKLQVMLEARDSKGDSKAKGGSAASGRTSSVPDNPGRSTGKKMDPQGTGRGPGPGT